MKQRLLTFLSMLLFLVIGAANSWAETKTIFSYTVSSSENSTDTEYTATGGTVTFTGGSFSAKNKVYYFKLASNNDHYVTVKLSDATSIKSGDKISITGYRNTDGSGLSYNLTKTSSSSDVYMTLSDASAAKGVVTTISNVITESLVGVSEFKIYRGDSKTFMFGTITITREDTKTISSQSFAGITIGGEESSDYTLSDATISLSNTYTVAPIVTLINKITYSDNSEETQNVSVTLAPNGDGTAYNGTATVKETEYTVSAPRDGSATAESKLEDVTGDKSWDFTTSATSDKKPEGLGNLVAFAEFNGWATNFDYKPLAGGKSGEYLYKSQNKCFQGSTLMFHATVPGTIKVVFSDTGNSAQTGYDTRQTRYLVVNDIQTNYSTNSTEQETAEVYVPAGDVTITAAGAGTAIRIYSIVFTAKSSFTATVGETGFATIGFPDAVTLPEGVTGYAITDVDNTANTVTLTKVETGTKIAANTGLIIMAKPAEYTFNIETEGTDVNSKLVANVDGAKTAESEGEFYVFGKTGDKTVGMMKIAANATLSQYKAYLPADLLGGTSETSAKTYSFIFEGNVTAVDTVEAAAATAEDGPAYNLAGQRVSNNAKGIRIVKGKKYFVK